MMVLKERLNEEIKSTKETIKKLQQIEKDSISGVEINNIVLKAFEAELEKCNSSQ